MTATIVAIAFGFLLAAVIIGVGWWQIREGGERDAKADQMRRERDASNARAEEASEPPARPWEASAALRRHLERLGRRLRDIRDGRK